MATRRIARRVFLAGALVAASVASGGLSGCAAPRGERSTSALDRVRERGELRVCMTGDYKPYGYQRPDGAFEGADVDFAEALAAALKVRTRYVKTTWSTLLDDFTGGACDIAMGGTSVTLERQMRVAFTEPLAVDGKVPIVRCADVSRYGSLAAIDRPGTRAIVNPGGANERFAKSTLKQAELRVYPDNVTIFDEIVAGRADVMITDESEARTQHRLRPALCAVPLEKPLQFGEKAWLLPRGDVPWKAFVDQWLHIAKATGQYDATMAKWGQ